MPRVLCVSVDVDSPALYLRLYGVHPDEALQQNLATEAYALGVQRFVDLFAEFGVKGTFFLVGQDLASKGAAGVAKALVAAGHEAANHSQTHPYDLIHRGEAALEEELRLCHQRIGAVTGKAPVGFRAPGYNTSPALLQRLVDLGYVYDASPLPSWPYLAAKYAVMAGLRLRGKRSSSIVGNPLMGFSPRQPSVTSQNLVKIPCTVTPWLRLPVIGTTLVSGPVALRRHLLASAASLPFVSLEFHAMDLMSVAEDLLPGELGLQKDLTIPWQQKRDSLRRALGKLLEDRDALTLEQYTRGRS
jgi:hypothetical protein